MISIKYANKLLLDGKYNEAYQLYKEIEKEIGSNILSYNLELCEKHLNKNQKTSKNNIALNDYFDNIYVVNLKQSTQMIICKKIK